MYKNLFILLAFIFIIGCSNEPSHQATESVEQDTTSLMETPEIETPIIIGDDTVKTEKTIPVKDEITKQGEDERTAKSVVKDEKCCTTPESIRVCCCEEILKKYKDFLQKEDWDGATNLKAVDPFFLACQKKQKDFEQQITVIEDEVFGEE